MILMMNVSNDVRRKRGCTRNQKRPAGECDVNVNGNGNGNANAIWVQKCDGERCLVDWMRFVNEDFGWGRERERVAES